ncbi:ATP-binding protein [Sphaerisporangium rhizosphaerae]|uniref:ATP-binding protein n=1 Tax=Sphaerisporangium rhizosphaerae TaxID=2269375 RepID=A0ABW2PHY4_9ACTN
MSAADERREDSPDSPAAGVTNEVSGIVSGPVVQAGAIHGDVRITVETRERPPPPAQLAPPPAVFDGRDDELARLDRYLAERFPAEASGQARTRPAGAAAPNVLVIHGVGGVGKSALALAWSQRVRDRFADGQLYAELRGPVPGAAAHPGEVLERFLRALDVAAPHLPPALDERVALYRSVTAGRRLLVMLDDALSAAQVRAILPASAESLVVVTTRHRLSGLVVEGARFVELSPLSEQEALGLLTRMLGPERTGAEPVAALDLVTLCGRLPIAVCACAARLALRPLWTIERVVRELADARHRLSALGADRDLSPQAAFDVSYEALESDQARLYRMLGLHPGPAFGTGAAAAAGDIDEGRAFRILDELAGAGLVEPQEQDRFRFHDLVHVHAHDKALGVEPAQECRAAFVRVATWYLESAVAADLVVVPGRWHLGPVYETAGAAAPAFEGPARALDWLENELPNLRAVLARARGEGLNEIAWQLTEAMWGLFLSRKHYDAWVDTHEVGLAAARACADPLAESRMLLATATAHLNLQNFPRAAEHCLRAVELERSAGHPIGEASALSSLGVAYLGMRLPDRAMERFRRALAIHEELGRPRGVALMTRRIGEAYRDLGRHDDAVAYLERAHESFRRLADPYNQARTLTGLGQTHLLAGRPREAVRPLTEALAIAGEIGARFEQANIRLPLAEALAGVGDRPGALGHLARAVEIFTELGAPQGEQARRRLDSLAAEPPR